MARQDVLSAVKAKPEVSVLVIGGGVNGIGTFRDLAHQGVDVLLVEKGDFSSGASAGSSHMLHGGIRYLENGEFRLVSEALTERNLMLRNAPHYAKPLPTAIPIFSWFSGFLNAPLKFLRLIEKPSERGAAVIKIGLIFYDWFARKHRVMPTHKMMGKQEALAAYPGIHPDIKCVARYYDAWMPYPERICLELMQDGEGANPSAHALNYVSAVGAEDGAVTLRDELTGETFNVKPKVVINAAGPWIDFAMQALGKPTGFIGGTKGSHLILDHPELFRACNGGEFFFENHDGRIVLILPYLDNKVMVGTTDIRINDPEEAVCTDDETDYMLGLVSRVFPGLKVGREHIVFTFSGVRPLPASGKGYTGNVSRDHSIAVSEAGEGGLPFPVLSLVGGKWTSFRAFSEQAADAALQRLGRGRKASTEHMALGGGRDYPSEVAGWVKTLADETSLPVSQVQTLFERYGTQARAIAGFMADGDDVPLVNNPAYTRRELMYLAGTEAVVRLDDLLLRRTLMAWFGGVTVALLEEVAGVVGGVLGWDAARQSAEVARARDLLAHKHGLGQLSQ
ncbi:MAG: glycerol-3-phosphate dehydrogenase/oxidase [Anaerolineae bacterium]|jgi:glycerol-3-phosphate dehydrogenase|nr:glycerol-3-phosphate dehydrogenase/oxidase [Anaerolineae bacterium]